MKRYHYSEKTGRANMCEAEKRSCPLGIADSEHVMAPSGADARRVFDERFGKSNLKKVALSSNKKEGDKQRRKTVVVAPKIISTENPNVVLYQGHKMTPAEAKMASTLRRMADDTVKQRYESGTIVLDDSINKDTAYIRLTNAIEYAGKRGNEDLQSKIAKATVVKGSMYDFKDGKGGKTRISTDELIKQKQMYEYAEDSRAHYENQINKVLANGSFSNGDKFSFRNETTGSLYTATVKEKEQANNDFIASLPRNVQQQISAPVSSVSIQKLRESGVSDDIIKEITYEEQVFDSIIPKKTIDVEGLSSKLTIDSNKSDKKKMEEALSQISANQQKMIERFGGKTTDIKNQYRDNNKRLKEHFAATNTDKKNLYIPTRNRNNGFLISSRQKVNSKKVQELVEKGVIPKDVAEFATTVTKLKPSADKAREVLSPEDYAKAFPKVRSVSLVFTEKVPTIVDGT